MTDLGKGFSADTARETLITADSEATRDGGGRTWGRRRRRFDVVGERPTTGEHAPVVRVVLVDVSEEPFLVLTELLADLARQVVRSCQRARQLINNTAYSFKTGFHYPSWRPELTARVDGDRFPLPVNTSRVDGPWRPVKSASGNARPSTPVNARQLYCTFLTMYANSIFVVSCIASHCFNSFYIHNFISPYNGIASNTLKIITINKQTKTKKQRNTSTNKVHLMFIMYHLPLSDSPFKKFIHTSTNNLF